MKNKDPERLLSHKLRLAWIIAPKRSLVFKPELNQFEDILKSVTREKAGVLAEYTVTFFKLNKVKTVMPPACNQAVASEVLCDELKNYFDRYRSITVFRKVIAWRDHCLQSIS